MTTPRHTRRFDVSRKSKFATAIVAAVAMTLSGCVTNDLAEKDESPSQQAVLDKLGPFPPDEPWTEADRESALNADADVYWSRVLALYPEAVRPEVTREAEVQADKADSVVSECLDEDGIKIEGTLSEFTPITEAENLSWYACSVRFPVVPRPPVSKEQLGYIYDYLTLFVAPCLIDQGSTVDEPPTRDFFVENWPNQNWFPAPSAEPGSTEYATMNEACPSSVGGY